MNTADRRRLGYIVEQIDRIERYAAGGREEFERNEMVQDAVLRCLTVIGEAAGALTESTYASIPSLPPYAPKGQRIILVHEYWCVDPDVVWATIERDLPPLRREITELLAE